MVFLNKLKCWIKCRFKGTFIHSILIYTRYLNQRYIIARAYSSYKLTGNVTLEAIDSGICFFGYYNISPANENGAVIYLNVNQEKARGSLSSPAKIMLKQPNGNILQIAETDSWNWQQGCMLQWHPTIKNQIIFNNYDVNTNQYFSSVIDITGKLIREYEFPVNNVSRCGKFALGLNYDRLAVMRPDYGYFNRKDIKLPSNEDDGIWNINLETGKVDLILTLEQLRQLSYSSTMDGAMHKVNHIYINPDGTRFMFLHRWIGPAGRFMRLITAKPEGSDLMILNGDKMTSHCCWLNDDQILSFCQVKSTVGYFKFFDRTDKVELFDENMPVVDGHPSLSHDGNFIITDTYPDKSRMSYIYLFNLKDKQLRKIGRFHQPVRYKGEMRIDLHPKWNVGGKTVFFESGHEGRRKLYCLSLN